MQTCIFQDSVLRMQAKEAQLLSRKGAAARSFSSGRRRRQRLPQPYLSDALADRLPAACYNIVITMKLTTEGNKNKGDSTAGAKLRLAAPAAAEFRLSCQIVGCTNPHMSVRIESRLLSGSITEAFASSSEALWSPQPGLHERSSRQKDCILQRCVY